MEKYIGLLDCNNFFASCERLFRPDLLGKPVLVLSSNDGCAIARSKEVKDLGIAMGVPYFKVKDICEQNGVEIFSTNFTLYRDVSARVMNVLREELGVVEQYSVDEAFFILEANNLAELAEKAKKIKALVEQQVGVPVSVGVAKSKTIAKYASKLAKKGEGTFVLLDKDWQKLQSEIALSEIWGIGGRSVIKMREKGLHTVADFLATDRVIVEKIFGVVGIRIYDELNEKSVFRMGEKLAAQQSIMSTRSFAKTTNERNVVADSLAYHVAEVCKELREMNMKARYLQIIAAPSRFGDWSLRQGAADVHLAEPTNSTREILQESLRLLDTFFDSEVPYKKAGVLVGSFVESGREQQSLFVNEEKTNDDALMSVLDSLVGRFGKESLRLGLQDKKQSWQSKHQKISPNYTTKWTDIPSVKA